MQLAVTLFAASTATVAALAIGPADAGAELIAPQAVNPTTVTPHVVTAPPAPQSAPAPATSASSAATSRTVTSAAPIASAPTPPSHAADSDAAADQGDTDVMPSHDDPACDLDCQRGWFDWYSHSAEAAWEIADGLSGPEGDLATEAARSLTREARGIEAEIRIEQGGEESGPDAPPTTPGAVGSGSASGGSSTGASSQPGDDAEEPVDEGDDDLGSVDLSWLGDAADALAGAVNWLYGDGDPLKEQ